MAGRSEFLKAVRDGNLPLVRAALAAAPELAASRDEDGVSAVRMALYNGHPEVARAIVKADPPMDIFDAAAMGDTRRLRELLENPEARVTGYAEDGFTALHLAAFFGHEEAAAMLLDAGADPDATTRNPMANRPIHAAAAGRHNGVARLLVEHGADVDAQQHGGWTALHSAAQHADLELVDLLLDADARLDPTSDSGETPADRARDAGHDDLARRLDPEA